MLKNAKIERDILGDFQTICIRSILRKKETFLVIGDLNELTIDMMQNDDQSRRI